MFFSSNWSELSQNLIGITSVPSPASKVDKEVEVSVISELGEGVTFHQVHVMIQSVFASELTFPWVGRSQQFSWNSGMKLTCLFQFDNI